jgi:poly-gamma-glutamate synthesis protein (capsule biosynthesis protein)
MPDGQVVLAEIEWVFALAAPFKTVQDDVTFADLQALWLGNPQGSTAHLSALAVHARDHASLAALLGAPPAGDGMSQMIRLLPDDTENISDFLNAETWALIPFDQLHPEVKVISVDGISPLDDDFPIQEYPLRGHYTLHTSPATSDRLPPEILNALLANLPRTNRDPDRMTTLVMTGVTALVRATAYRMETQGILYPARDIGDWLSSADVTHISNEVSFTENCPFPDPYDPLLTFCSHPSYISLLDFIGADVIELTGNHNNDAARMFDESSFDTTLAMYDAHGMLTFGGGLNLEDAMQPALISHNGNHLAFIGCNIAGPNFAWATSTSGGAAPCGDLTWMEDTIQRLRQDGYLPIVTFQYYEDYANDASPQMKADFRRMAEAGAVIVNGSQAHRPKEMEFLDGALLHYGLGNLFFDQMTVTINGVEYTQTRNEFIQRHVLYDGRYISTQLLTAVLEDWAKPRPMTPGERQVFLSEIFSVSP